MPQHILAMLATFSLVFLKGFQQKNVQHNHYRAAFCVSYVMGITDAAVIMFVGHQGWSVVPWTATGAAFGIITAMWAHTHLRGTKHV